MDRWVHRDHRQLSLPEPACPEPARWEWGHMWGPCKSLNSPTINRVLGLSADNALFPEMRAQEEEGEAFAFLFCGRQLLGPEQNQHGSDTQSVSSCPLHPFLTLCLFTEFAPLWQPLPASLIFLKFLPNCLSLRKRQEPSPVTLGLCATRNP